MVSTQARNGRLCGLNAKGIASEASTQDEWKEGNEKIRGIVREKAPRVKIKGGKAAETKTKRINATWPYTLRTNEWGIS